MQGDFTSIKQENDESYTFIARPRQILAAFHHHIEEIMKNKLMKLWILFCEKCLEKTKYFEKLKQRVDEQVKEKLEKDIKDLKARTLLGLKISEGARTKATDALSLRKARQKREMRKIKRGWQKPRRHVGAIVDKSAFDDSIQIDPLLNFDFVFFDKGKFQPDGSVFILKDGSINVPGRHI